TGQGRAPAPRGGGGGRPSHAPAPPRPAPAPPPASRVGRRLPGARARIGSESAGGEAMESARVAAVLEARRAELAAELEALRRPTRGPGAERQDGERVGGPTNEAIEQRTRGMTAQRLQQVADEVGRALEKLAEGSHGRCDRCRRPIPAERLEALPWASLCVACKSQPPRR